MRAAREKLAERGVEVSEVQVIDGQLSESLETRTAALAAGERPRGAP
jgi:hypothetical protein